MKLYFFDANFILRFLLQDNIKQYEATKQVMFRIERHEVKAKLVSEVFMEVEYVLRKLYKIPRQVISQKLLEFIKTEWIEIEKKDLLAKSLEKYPDTNIDLVDMLLYFQTKKEKGEILTFDEDFRKLGVKMDIRKVVK